MFEGHSEYYKLRFEMFPIFCPYIEMGHEIINRFSRASWSKNKFSSEYEFAHIWVCQWLYSYYNNQNDIDDADLLKLLLDERLEAIAEAISANHNEFMREFPKMLN